MVRERKIQDNDRLYNFLRHYVDFMLKHSYRKIRYVGREKIPSDGAVIYAPNHTNALMDALVILALDKKPKVFVARADIFKNPKIAKILTFLKILPIMRIRDGFEEVKKNNVTIEKAVDVLRDRVPFCILPEGTHRAMHSLLPLSKGIFRIAIQAQEILGEEVPLYIVPMGLEYGNFFRYHSTVLVQVGNPINIRDFIAGHKGLTEAEEMNILKEELTKRMKEVILYIPDDEFYDATHEICAAVANEQRDIYLKEHPDSGRRSLDTRYNTNKKTLAEIADMRSRDTAETRELLEKADETFHQRNRAGISLNSVTLRHPLLSGLLKIILLIISLPYTLTAGTATLPLTGVCAFLFTKMKDRAFFNSIRMVVNLVLWPVLLIIYAVIAYSVLPWEIASCIVLLLAPASYAAMEIYRLFRLAVSDIRLALHRPLRNNIRAIRRIYFGSK